jgi:hypothetical protein
MPRPRRKNAPNVSKKFEDVLKKSELGPAESNLGAPKRRIGEFPT